MSRTGGSNEKGAPESRTPSKLASYYYTAAMLLGTIRSLTSMLETDARLNPFHVR